MPKNEPKDDFSHVPNVAFVSPMELKPNRVLIGLGVGATVIALGTLGYLLVDKLLLGESATAVPNIEINKKLPVTKVSTPSAQKDETADWKTYKDETYGYSIEHPSNFTRSVDTSIDYVAFDSPDLTVKSQEPFIISEGFRITINVTKTNQSFTLEDALEQSLVQSELLTKEKIQLDKSEAYKVGKITLPFNPNRDETIELLVVRNNKEYVLRLISLKISKDEGLRIFNLMLSTFSFD